MSSMPPKPHARRGVAIVGTWPDTAEEAVTLGGGRLEYPEPPELTRLRGKIEENDRVIVDGIRRRVELALEAGQIKRAAGIPVFDPEREREVEQRVLEYARSCGLDEAHIRLVVRGLIALARTSQEEER